MSGSFRVAIEGNIGVGKSTLLPALADALPGAWNVLDERVDEDPEFKALLANEGKVLGTLIRDQKITVE